MFFAFYHTLEVKWRLWISRHGSDSLSENPPPFLRGKVSREKNTKNGSSSQKTWLVGGFNPSQEYAHHLKQSSQVWLKNNTYWNPELMIDTWFDVDPPTKAALEFIVLTGKHLSCGDQKQPIINHLLWPPSFGIFNTSMVFMVSSLNFKGSHGKSH